MAQGTTKGVPIDIDGTLSQNSDLLVASQKATKTYVDNGLLLKQNVIGYTPVNKGGDTMIGNLILNGNPTLPLQAATKDYIDTLINGIDWKQAANAATVSALPAYNVTGSGAILTGTSNGAIPSATTDGVTLVAGNRLLVKNETSTLTPNNGIYVVTQAGNGSTPFILTRSDDANTPSEISEATLSVSGGSTLSNTQWHCNPASVPVVIGTTYITFAQIGSGTYSAGSGLTLTGNVFSIPSNGVTDAMIQSATNWNTAYTNRITSATSPLSITSNTISIQQASASQDGYLSSSDWSTFNSKQGALTLTTTGTSGAATFTSGTLNIPQYQAALTNPITGTAISGQVAYFNGTTSITGSSGLVFDGTNLGIGIAAPAQKLTVNGDVSIATILNATTDTDKFLVSDGGIIKYRTGSEILSDIGGQAALTNPVTGTGTTNELTYWTSSSAVGSLSTATYPSLTELSYVKGVTSAIQTQLNGKQGTLTLTTTGTSGASTLVGNTLNIPQYQSVLTNPVTGTGTTNEITYWSSSSTISSLSTATYPSLTELSYIKGVTSSVQTQIDNKFTLPSFTNGSVIFSNGTTLAQDNANFFWDDTNNRLGIGTATPSEQLHILKSTAAGSLIESTTTSSFASLTVKTGTIGALFRAYGSAFSVASLASKAGFGPDGATGLVIFTNSTLASGGTGSLSIRGGGYDTAAECLLVDQTGTTFTKQLKSTVANSTTTGGGQIYLNGASGNRIDFNQNGFAAPTFTTRSAGTKICLFPAMGSTTLDYAIGIDSATQWYSVPEATNAYFFKWYAGTTNILTLNGTGNMTLSRNQNAITSFTVSNTTSGTASQSYISLTSDASSSNGIIAKTSTGYTAYKILAAKDFYIYNNTTGGDISILNDFASGAIKFAAGASSTAQVTISSNGSLSVGTTSPSASSILQVDSTTKGFLPPRMTATQRAAITTPADGLIVYQTDGTSGLYVYNGSSWRTLAMV